MMKYYIENDDNGWKWEEVDRDIWVFETCRNYWCSENFKSREYSVDNKFHGLRMIFDEIYEFYWKDCEII